MTKDVEAIFEKSGALLKGHFLLASGLHSPVYWEKALVLQYPEYTEKLCGMIADHYRTSGIQVVAGPTTPGIILAYETARQLGVRGIFAEKDDSGGRVFRRGFSIEPGERVLIVDDIFSTGGSIRDVMQVVEPDLTTIRWGAILHDVGKIGVPDQVLLKPGKLDSEEWDLMRQHPEMGYRMLQHIPFLRPALDIVFSHQERFDGTGYPRGLKGEEIPLGARIIAVADSFDAMTSKRTYRDAMTVEQALAEIEKGLGTQFDEQVGRIFLDSDVYRLWDIIQDGFSETYGMSNFSEYGTIAVGTLIK